MNASTLSRWAGLSAIASGILFIAIQLIHPSDVLSSVTTDRWLFVHILGVAMCLFGLFGVTGLYVRQVNAAGWLGFAGFLFMSLFYAFSMAFQFIEAFISPKLATESPKYVDGLLGIPAGHGSEVNLGALPEVYAVTGGLHLLGGVLFGVATFRAGILPRLAASSLAFATVLPLVGASVPHPLDRAFAVPIGLALAWLGYALWSERREHVTALAPDSEGSPLQVSTAD